jgi:hypothetical protein
MIDMWALRHCALHGRVRVEDMDYVGVKKNVNHRRHESLSWYDVDMATNGLFYNHGDVFLSDALRWRAEGYGYSTPCPVSNSTQ